MIRTYNQLPIKFQEKIYQNLLFICIAKGFENPEKEVIKILERKQPKGGRQWRYFNYQLILKIERIKAEKLSTGRPLDRNL